jgi:hypothetical protein
VLILNHLRKQLSPLDATLTKTGGGGLPRKAETDRNLKHCELQTKN